jgi:hypothetical protein
MHAGRITPARINGELLRIPSDLLRSPLDAFGKHTADTLSECYFP